MKYSYNLPHRNVDLNELLYEKCSGCQEQKSACCCHWCSRPSSSAPSQPPTITSPPSPSSLHLLKWTYPCSFTSCLFLCHCFYLEYRSYTLEHLTCSLSTSKAGLPPKKRKLGKKIHKVFDGWYPSPQSPGRSRSYYGKANTLLNRIAPVLWPRVFGLHFRGGKRHSTVSPVLGAFTDLLSRLYFPKWPQKYRPSYILRWSDIDITTTEKQTLHLWKIHVDVWQETTKFCKAIILQLKKREADSSLKPGRTFDWQNEAIRFQVKVMDSFLLVPSGCLLLKSSWGHPGCMKGSGNPICGSTWCQPSDVSRMNPVPATSVKPREILRENMLASPADHENLLYRNR